MTGATYDRTTCMLDGHCKKKIEGGEGVLTEIHPHLQIYIGVYMRTAHVASCGTHSHARKRPERSENEERSFTSGWSYYSLHH